MFTFFIWLAYKIFIEPRIQQQKELEFEFKKKLKYLNPTITTNCFGTKKISWTLRDKPLTDDELQILLNS